MSGSRLSLQGVTKRFFSKRKPITVLENITLDIAQEEFISLVGTSGCGKSTLLTIVAGLQSSDDGSVFMDGSRVDGPGRDRGVVFQAHTLLPWLTAQGNVEFALRAAGRGRKEARDLALEHLRLVKLEGCADLYPKQLSGGMKQRVAIARTLSYQPSVVLMDEPFGALDALTRAQMQELLTQIWEAHKMTVVMVTHDVEEAVFLSDRVVVMGSTPGRIKASFAVDLPRPRSREWLRKPEVAALQAQILTSIREEMRETGWIRGRV